MSPLLTLHDPATAQQFYASGVWRQDTLYSLASRHSREQGQAWAVRDGYRRLNWRTLVEWVDAVAELATLMGRIDCRALFMQPGWGADANTADTVAAAAALGHVQCIFALPSLHESDSALPTGSLPMPQAGNHDLTHLPSPSERPDQICYLAFTSGTTGTPKGVMHSDNTLLANGRAMVADWAQDAKTVLLSLSPMSHHIGTVGLEQVLVVGGELVMFDPGAGVAALDWIQTTGAT